MLDIQGLFLFFLYFWLICVGINLVSQFEDSSELLLQYIARIKVTTIYEVSREFNRVAYCLERVLKYGLKKGFFTDETLWGWLKNLPACVPGVKDIIEDLTYVLNSKYEKFNTNQVEILVPQKMVQRGCFFV